MRWVNLAPVHMFGNQAPGVQSTEEYMGTFRATSKARHDKCTEREQFPRRAKMNSNRRAPASSDRAIQQANVEWATTRRPFVNTARTRNLLLVGS